MTTKENKTKKNNKEKEAELEEMAIETWDQDDETVEGGIEFREKYFQRFGAFVRAELNELIMVNCDTGEETKLDQPVKLIALYAHPSISITKGILAGKDRKDWSDEESTPVAKTLLSPFGKKQKSFGSFENARLLEWIQDSKKYSQLVNRCWIIGRIKDWQDGRENIIFSFGASAWHSFESARKTLKTYNRHISTNFLELSLDQAVNDDGQKYFKPTFKIVSKGSTCKAEDFAEKFGGEIAKLKKEHLEEVANTENQMLIPYDAIEYEEPVQIEDQTSGSPPDVDDDGIAF